MASIHGKPDPGWSDGTRQSAWLLRARDCDAALSLVASGALDLSPEMVRSLEAAREEARSEASRLSRRHSTLMRF